MGAFDFSLPRQTINKCMDALGNKITQKFLCFDFAKHSGGGINVELTVAIVGTAGAAKKKAAHEGVKILNGT